MTDSFSQLSRMIFDPVLEFDDQQRVLTANAPALELLGYRSEELLGQPLEMLLPSLYRPSHSKLFAEFSQGEGVPRQMGQHRRVFALRKDTSTIPVLAAIARITNNGQSRLVATLHPIAYNEESNKLIRLMSEMVDESPNPILRIAPDGLILFANRPAWDLLADIVSPGSQPVVPGEWLEIIRNVVLTGKLFSSIRTYVGKTHMLLFIPVSGAGYVNVFAYNVTEQSRTQAELEMAVSILRSASNLILVANSDAQIVYVSPSVQNILGYAPEEFLGDGWWKFLDNCGKMIGGDRDYVRRAARGEVPVDTTPYEHALRHRDGSPRWIMIADSKGPRDLLIGIGTDVTAMRMVQEELNQRNKFVETIVNSMGQGLTVLNEDGLYEYVNPAYARMLACAPEDLLGKAPELFTVSDDVAAMQEARRNRIQGLTTTYEVRLRALDGREVVALITGVPRIQDGRYEGSISVITDLTERKLLETALLESGEWIRALYEVAVQQAPFEEKIQNILRMGCQRFGLEVGIFARVEDQRYQVVAVESQEGLLQPGQEFPLSQTYCVETLVAKAPVGFEHAAASRWANHPCYQAFRLEAYLGTKVVVENKVYGTLNFSSTIPHAHPFSPIEHDLLSLMAQWVGTELERDLINRRLKENAEEIERSNIALSSARDEAMESNRLKSVFLATMSHEIRTPMNAILGMTEMLLDSDLDEQQREFTSIVSNSAEALMVLINDILDLSKIEAGKLILHPRPFQTADLFAEVVNLFQLKADKKRIHLASQMDPAIPPSLVGDADRIRQVLINLVGNAVKFTNYGMVSISASLAGSEEGGKLNLRFDVRDTGIGISAEGQEMLFEPFIQVDSSITRRYGGSGLGLVISRRLVELMNGKLGVKSQEGLGSHFWFVLPLSQTEQPAAPETPDRSAVRQDMQLGYLAANPVLLVEDNTTNQIVATSQLNLLGVRVEAVDSGQQAVERLLTRAKDYSIVLMDVHMPDMSGLEATLLVREKEAQSGGHIPIIAMTANAMVEDRLACITAGMDDYISKPVSLSDLAEKLKKWLPK